MALFRTRFPVNDLLNAVFEGNLLESFKTKASMLPVLVGRPPPPQHLSGHVELLTSATYPGLVFKPVTAGELSFYQRLPEPLAPYTSTCYGTCQIPAKQVEADLDGGAVMPPAFLIMEDVTAGMKEPAVLDLKLGFRQRAAHHGPSKRSSMKAKCAMGSRVL
ncbi:putative inositol polyphosphate kinase [Symbiodinium microadriaticum]|uniref:Kinase n=1 Tax=Symbiodinium microadriaticum TaxID=2951 RepID=A0A1Q9CFV8_SYMMI|nr:putative inositol polyphosphate kinase [Symbiodinium microadriaticum]